MEIIKEMHGALYNEREFIEKEEAEINMRLQQLNFRRAALSRKEDELKRLTDIVYSSSAMTGGRNEGADCRSNLSINKTH